tara:strand:- start:5351 stop:14017 length:8667 start_codon:yes stop_codon:yes gene_type:complete
MTDSLLDAANPGGNEEALIASSKYLEKFDQLKRNQLGNENYNEDNKTLIDETTEVEPSNYNPEVINKDQIESDQYYKEKFQEPGRKDTKTSTPFLGLYDKLNIFTKDYGGEYAPEELRGQHRLRNSIGDLFRIADRGVISGTVGLTNTVNDALRQDMPGFMAEMLSGDPVGATALSIKAMKAGIDKKSFNAFLKELGGKKARMSILEAMETGAMRSSPNTLFKDLMEGEDPFAVKDIPAYDPMDGSDRLSGENWGLLMGEGKSMDEIVGGFPVRDTGRPVADFSVTFAGEAAPFFLTFAAAKFLTPGLPDEYVYAAKVFNQAKAGSPQFARAVAWMTGNMPRVSKVSKFLIKEGIQGARNSLIAETLIGDPYQPSLADNLLPDAINNNGRLEDNYIEAKLKSIFVNEIINGIPMGIAFGVGGKAISTPTKFGIGFTKGTFPGLNPGRYSQMSLLDNSINAKTAQDYGYSLAKNTLASLIDTTQARVIEPLVTYLAKWKLANAAIDNAYRIRKELEARNFYEKTQKELLEKDELEAKTKIEKPEEVDAEIPELNDDNTTTNRIKINNPEAKTKKDIQEHYGQYQRKPEWETGYTEQQKIDLEKEAIKAEKIAKKKMKELGNAAKDLQTENNIQAQIRPDEDRTFSNELGQSVGLAAPLSSEISKLKLSDIIVRPDIFQPKAEGKLSKKGISGSLRDVEVFDPMLADLLSVWRDTTGELGEVGKIYVVDGHNRLDLAQRSGIGEIDVRFIQAGTVKEAQQIAVLRNLAQSTTGGKLTSLDVAKYMQSSGDTLEDLATKGITLTSKEMIEGNQLARLPKYLLDKVSSGELPFSKGVALGSVEGASETSINFVYNKYAKNPKFSGDRIRQIMLASTRTVETVTEGTLPGLEKWSMENNLPEITAIAEQFLKELRIKISGLKAVTQKNKKAAIEQIKGNKIAYDESIDKKLEAEKAVARFEELAYSVSDTNALINDLAAQMKTGPISATMLVKDNFDLIMTTMRQDDAPLTKVASEPVRVQSEVDAKLNAKAQNILNNERPDPIPDKEIDKVVNEQPELDTYSDKSIKDIKEELKANNGSLNKNHSKIGEVLKASQTTAKRKTFPYTTDGGYTFNTAQEINDISFDLMFPTLKAKYPNLDFSSTRWAGSAKPRYGQYTLEFANDIDKAIYITGNRWKGKSKKDAEFNAFLEELGISSGARHKAYMRMKEGLKVASPKNGVISVKNTMAYADIMMEPINKKGSVNADGTVNIRGNYVDGRGYVQRDPRVDDPDFELDADLPGIERENIRKANKKLQDKYNQEYKDSTNPKNFDPLDPKNDEQLEFALEDDLYTNMGNDHVYVDTLLTEQQAQELVDVAREIAGANVQNLRLVDAIEPKITAKSAAAYGFPESAIGKTGRAKGVFKFGSTPAKDLIILAMTFKGHFQDFGSMMQTLRHESFHRIQDRYLTLKEQRLLDSPAVDKKLREIVASFYPRHQSLLYGPKRMSEREVQAFAFSVFDQLDYAKKPTWLQPFEKLKEIAEKINNKLNGFGFKSYKEIFRDAQEGRLATRTPRPFRYAKNTPGNTAPEPASFELDPDEFVGNLEAIKTAIRDGDMSIEEAMTGLYRRLINRRQNPEGKVYIPTDQVDLIANNKAIENTLFEQIGSREDATNVPSFNVEEITRLASRVVAENGYRTEEIFNLHKQAMNGDSNALQRQVAQAAVILQRDAQVMQMQQVALDVKMNPQDVTSKRLLISLWEDAMKISTAIAQVNRPSAQYLRMQQMDFLGKQEMFIEPYAKIEIQEPKLGAGGKALNEGVEKGGMVEDKGLGKGTYFKSVSEGREPGVTGGVIEGQVPATMLILDLTSQNKTLSQLFKELDVEGVGAVQGEKLTDKQKSVLFDYLAKKKYQGVRLDGFELGQQGDMIYVPDSNQANIIINSKAAEVEGQDMPYQASIPGSFEKAVLEQEDIFKNLMDKKDYDSIMNGKPTPEAQAILDVIAESLYLYRDRTASFDNFMSHFAKGLDTVNTGKLVQEKIAAVARNGIFLNSSTLGKVLGGSLFRAMTLPYSQYMGAGYTKRKALKAGDMEGAKMAEMRQKLNLAMYLKMFVGTQNSFRLALSAIKHDEVFGNINKGYMENSTYSPLSKNKAPKIRRFDMYSQQDIEGEAQRMLGKDRKVPKRYTTATTNPVILMAHYVTKGIKGVARGGGIVLGSGASRLMSGLDTFIGMSVAPAYEYARLMEQELFLKMKAGFDMNDPRVFAEAQKKTEAALTRAMADVEMPDGSVIKGGFMDSTHARQAIDYVNFTDDIKVDRNKRTMEYGIRRAQELGYTEPEDILEFAETYIRDVDENNLDYFTDASQPTAPSFLGLGGQENGLDRLGQTLLNAPSKGVKDLTRAAPIMGVVFPTNRTPLNLVKSALRHLPLPTNRIVDSYWRDITSEDLFQRERALGEIATSQTLFAVGVGAVATGLVEFSGPDPSNPNRRELNRGMHRPPNAVRFRLPGSHEWSHWYSLDMFDTASFIFGAIGGYVDAIKRMPQDEAFDSAFDSQEEMNYSDTLQEGFILANAHVFRTFDDFDQAKNAAGTMGRALLSTVKENTVGYFRKSVMANVGNFMDLIQELSKDDLGGKRYGQTGKRNLFEMTLARFVKMPLAQLRTTKIGFDNKRYMIKEHTDQDGKRLPISFAVDLYREMLSSVPGFQTDPERAVVELDPIFGEPLVYDYAFGAEKIKNPLLRALVMNIHPLAMFRPTKERNGIIYKELSRLHGEGAYPRFSTKNSLAIPGYVMSNQELMEFRKIMTKEVTNSEGLTLSQKLEQYFRSDGYKSLPDYDPKLNADGLPADAILNSKTLYKLTAVKAIIDEYREAAREIMKKRYPHLQHLDNLNVIKNKKVSQARKDFPNQIEAWRSIVNTDVRTG